MTDAPDDSILVQTARDYYNSEDADRFYSEVWGGEDIHIGLYDDETDIATASRRTVQWLATSLDPALGADSRVLDLGSGYCGAARYLAQNFDCQITALNLSDVENQRARERNKAQGLEAKIEVLDGNFEHLPFDDQSFDVAWSQDAILHSGARRQVLAEVHRVLKPGGQFVFTDPMQSDECPEGVLQPILDRIHLANLGSPGFYLQTGRELGLEGRFEDRTEQLVTHYSKIVDELSAREDELKQSISEGYVTGMKEGLRHWIEGGERGHLAWGLFHFTKQ